MVTEDCLKFEKNWEKFAARLQGQMIMQMEKGIFSFASLNLILADCVGFWDSKHSEGKRWLDDYEKKNPDKAAIIQNILLEDMKFHEEITQVKDHNYVKYLAAGVSAVIGLVISRNGGATAMVQAVCTIAPAAVAYPVVNNIVSSVSDKQKKTIIRKYMEQLEKYKVSIQSILSDEN